MSESESSVMKDNSIHDLIQLLSESTDYLKDLRNEIKDLRNENKDLRSENEDLKRKLDQTKRAFGMRDTSTQTRKPEPTPVSEPETTSFGQFSTEKDTGEATEKLYQNKLNDVDDETFRMSAETNYLSDTSSEKVMNNPRIAELTVPSGVHSEDIKTNINESVPIRENMDDENLNTKSISTVRRSPDALSFERLTWDETTQKGYVRYRESRSTVKNKNKSTKTVGAGDNSGEGHAHSKALGNKQSHTRKESPIGLHRAEDCNAGMHTVNDRFQHEGREYALSSSYNDFEMNCNTMNGQNKTANTGSQREFSESFDNVRNPNIPKRSVGQEDVVPVFLVPASSLYSHNFYISRRTNEYANDNEDTAEEASEDYGMAEENFTTAYGAQNE